MDMLATSHEKPFLTAKVTGKFNIPPATETRKILTKLARILRGRWRSGKPAKDAPKKFPTTCREFFWGRNQGPVCYNIPMQVDTRRF